MPKDVADLQAPEQTLLSPHLASCSLQHSLTTATVCCSYIPLNLQYAPVAAMLFQVLYMTFERLLLLASGILVTPQDYTKVKQLMQTQSQTQMQVAVQSDDGDIAAELNQVSSVA
jgi:hypothetical protein